MTRRSRRRDGSTRGFGARGVSPCAVVVACALLAPASALARPGAGQDGGPGGQPSTELGAPLEGPARALDHADAVTMPGFELQQPALVALPPLPASLIGPPILAKRKRDRTFDTEYGEKDPRGRSLPRTHRFRLALHSHWVRLTRTQNPATGEFERFHYAPLMLDLAYQAQFLKYVMVRLAVGVGGNVGNTRNAMPVNVFPQGYVGFQHKIIGVAFGYGFDWTIPPNFNVTSTAANALAQPVITRNHVIMGELSATSHIDRVALTFALSIGGIQSDLDHFDTQNRKWRPYFGFALGAFFDGTIRREKKAEKRAKAEGR